MKIRLSLIFLILGICFSNAQSKQTKKASSVIKAVFLGETPPLAGRNLIPEQPRTGNINPRRTNGNKVIPGKGSKGVDPLLAVQKQFEGTRQGKAPSLIFEANASSNPGRPSDPTGAVGPNHYLTAKNSAFAIYDRAGNTLVSPTSLANIWPGEALGDPIVFYDNFAKRFVITQFSNSPNGFLVAVCQGEDPVNDGWFTYRFETGSFPDYTKFSIWSDGYYVTANKDQNSPSTSEVVFAIERDKLLAGDSSARMVGFSLPGISNNGFYSPGGFHATGSELPPAGDMKIIFMQDDSWNGVSDDSLKLWSINVDWDNPESSTIAEAEELTANSGAITNFDSVFDGGSFSNIPLPNGGTSLDAIQSTMMYMTSYRRFCDYNSVVLNFAVDIDNRENSDNIAGIRWYELRQAGDGQPWTVYQEGTYQSPDGKSAWCGSMAMDAFGNIALAYTTAGTVANDAAQDSFVAIRYTGRLTNDPLGTMPISENTIQESTANPNGTSGRYGDYAHLTIDPTDDQSFWHIAEYFENNGVNTRNIVGVFKIATNPANDVRVFSIDSPSDGTLTTSETLTVTIQNLGTSTQSNIPVSYQIDGGTTVDEIFTGSIPAGAKASFTFATTADLTTSDSFEISVRTNLAGDANPANDCNSKTVDNIDPVDLGVVSFISPESNSDLSASSVVTIRISNFGGEDQSNIPVSYSVNNGAVVNETIAGPIAVGESLDYSFTQTADLSQFGTYNFVITVDQADDVNPVNNTLTVDVIKQICKPTSDCEVDRITSLTISDLTNAGISCGTGYDDFTNLIATLDRTVSNYTIRVQSAYANADDEKFSLWIDFNDNKSFEVSERLITDAVITQANIEEFLNLIIPTDAPTGDHLMRVRIGDTAYNGNLNDPCDPMEYGNTQDYTARVTDPLSIDDFTFENSEMVVTHLPNDQFKINLTSQFEGKLTFNVYTLSGQILVANYVTKNGLGVYTYDLDMSYAASGVYLVSMSNGNNKITEKIIVR